MLEKEFRVLKILDKELLLLSLDDKKELLWPREYLPGPVEVCDSLSLEVFLEPDLLERKKVAQDVLNEILQIDD